MDGETFDIYEDLDNFDASHQLKEKNEECQNLKQKYNYALRKIKQLEIDRQNLQKKLENMERNFSSLLCTVRAELSRKETQIRDLRKEKDDICFRRNIRYKKDILETDTSNVESVPRRINPFAVTSKYIEKGHSHLRERSSHGPDRYRSDYSRTEHEDKNKSRWKGSRESELHSREDNHRQRQFDENKKDTRVTKVNFGLLDKKNSSNITKEIEIEKRKVIPNDSEKLKGQIERNEKKSQIRQGHSPIRKDESKIEVGLATENKKNVEINPSDRKPTPKMICISVDNIKNRIISLEGSTKSHMEPSSKEEKPKTIERRITLSEYKNRQNTMNSNKLGETKSMHGSLIVISVDNKESSEKPSILHSNKTEETKSMQGSLIVTSVDNKESNEMPSTSDSVKKDVTVDKEQINTLVNEEKKLEDPKKAKELLTVISSKSISKSVEDKGTSKDQVEEITLVTTDLSFSENRENVGINTNSCKQSAETESLKTIIEKKEVSKDATTKSSVSNERTFKDFLIDELVYGEFGNNNRNEEEEEEECGNDISDSERLFIDLESPTHENPIPVEEANMQKEFERNDATSENNVKGNNSESPLEPSLPKIEQKCENRTSDELPANYVGIESNTEVKEKITCTEYESDINKRERSISQSSDQMKTLSTEACEEIALNTSLPVKESNFGVMKTNEADLPKDTNLKYNDEARAQDCVSVIDEKAINSETQEKYEKLENNNMETDQNKTDKNYDKFVLDRKIFTTSLNPKRSSTPVETTTFFGNQKNTSKVNNSIENVSLKGDSIEKELENMFKDTPSSSQKEEESVSNERGPTTPKSDNSFQNVTIKAQKMFELYLASPTHVIPTEVEKPKSKEKTSPSQTISGTKKRKSSTPRKSPGLSGRIMKLVGHRIEGFEPGNRRTDALEASKLKNALFKEVIGTEEIGESTAEINNKLKENDNELRNSTICAGIETNSKAPESKEDKCKREKKLDYSEEQNIINCENKIAEPEVIDKNETLQETSRQEDTEKNLQNICENDESDIFKNINDSMISQNKQTESVSSGVIIINSSTKSEGDVRANTLMKINTTYKYDISIENSRNENRSTNDINVREDSYNNDVVEQIVHVNQDDKEENEAIAAKQMSRELSNDESEEDLKTKSGEATLQVNENNEARRKQDHVRIIPKSTGETSNDAIRSSEDTNVEKQLIPNDHSIEITTSKTQQKIEILSVVTIKPEDSKLGAILTNKFNTDEWLNSNKIDENSTENSNLNECKEVIHILDESNSTPSASEQEGKTNVLQTNTPLTNDLDQAKETNVIEGTLDNQGSQSFKEPLVPDEIIDISASPASGQYYSDISSSDGFSNSPPEVHGNQQQQRSYGSPYNCFKRLNTINLNTSSQSSLSESSEWTEKKHIQSFVEDFCKSIESVDDETVSDSIRSYASDQGTTPGMLEVNFGNVHKHSDERKVNILTSNASNSSQICEKVEEKSEENILVKKKEKPLKRRERLPSVKNVENSSCSLKTNADMILKEQRFDIANTKTIPFTEERKSDDERNIKLFPNKHEKELQSLGNEESKSEKSGNGNHGVDENSLLKDHTGVLIKEQRLSSINTDSIPVKEETQSDKNNKKIISNKHEKEIHSQSNDEKKNEKAVKKKNRAVSFSDIDYVCKEKSKVCREVQSEKSHRKNSSKQPKKQEGVTDSSHSKILETKTNEDKLNKISTVMKKDTATSSKNQEVCGKFVKTTIRGGQKRKETENHHSKIPGNSSKLTQHHPNQKGNSDSCKKDDGKKDLHKTRNNLQKESSHLEGKQSLPKVVPRKRKASVFSPKKESKKQKISNDIDEINFESRPQDVSQSKVCDENEINILLPEKTEKIGIDPINTTGTYETDIVPSEIPGSKKSEPMNTSDKGSFKDVPVSSVKKLLRRTKKNSYEVVQVLENSSESRDIVPEEMTATNKNYPKTEQNKIHELFGKSPISPARKKRIKDKTLVSKAEYSPLPSVRYDISSQEHLDKTALQKSHLDYSDTCLTPKEDKKSFEKPELVPNPNVSSRKLNKKSKNSRETMLSHSKENSSLIQKSQIQEGGTRCHRIEIEARIVPHRELHQSILKNNEGSFESEKKQKENKENSRGIKRPYPDDSRTSQENLTCDKTNNNNSIFNDSGIERKFMSTSFRDYVIEPVNSDVCTVYITRKKRKKRST